MDTSDDEMSGVSLQMLFRKGETMLQSRSFIVTEPVSISNDVDSTQSRDSEKNYLHRT